MSRAQSPEDKLAQVKETYLGSVIPNIRHVYEKTGLVQESFVLVHCALLSLSGFYAGTNNTSGSTYRKFVTDFFPSQYNAGGLWKDLRNGLIHAYTLTSHYVLSHRHSEMHLYQMRAIKKESTGELVDLSFLNFEDFLADFEQAAHLYFERAKAESELLTKLCARYDLAPPATYIPDREVPTDSKLGMAVNTRRSTSRRSII